MTAFKRDLKNCISCRHEPWVFRDRNMLWTFWKNDQIVGACVADWLCPMGFCAIRVMKVRGERYTKTLNGQIITDCPKWSK